jgi:hypothetical protein
MRRAVKIVSIAPRRDRGDNQLRVRNIRNSISLTMSGSGRIIYRSFSKTLRHPQESDPSQRAPIG